MQKVKDMNLPYRAGWMVQNPETLGVTASDLIPQWRKAEEAVREEGKAIVLLSRHEMVGTIVPASLLYEFHRKMPFLKAMDPIAHVTKEDFRQNFENCADHLRAGMNLVILDGESKPVFGIANKFFSVDLKTDGAGRVEFSGQLAKYMFNDDEPEDSELPDFPACGTICMLKADQKRVDAAIDAIYSVRRHTRKSIDNAVNTMSLDLP